MISLLVFGVGILGGGFDFFVVFQQNMELVRIFYGIVMGGLVIMFDLCDWCFQDEIWLKNFFYKWFLQVYLVLSEVVEQMIFDDFEFDVKVCVQLVLDIVISMLLFINMFVGNLVVMMWVIEMWGDSLVKGFRNFVFDFLNNDGMFL